MSNARVSKISEQVYEVEKGKKDIGDKLDDLDYLVLDTMDTNKDTLGDEIEPKENSMQAMGVVEIKINTNLV